jgi:hypothetical protein
MWFYPRIARATRIDRLPSLGSWDMDADPVAEADGGTFYRPDGEWIEFEITRPRSSGLFSVPAVTLSVGDTAEATAQEAECWLEFADATASQIAIVLVAWISADGGLATRQGEAETMIELTGNEEIHKARWIITGGKGLAWSGSGTLEQLA